MTVEQNVLQQSTAQKHQQTFLNQLREITGINDTQILQQALKDSNGNLELAVAFLTAKNAKTPPQEETAYYQTALPGNDRYISVGSQADASDCDLSFANLIVKTRLQEPQSCAARSLVEHEHRNLPFMRELRYLFALLVGTKRKYVDPSRAVEILKDAFKSNDSQQQDVSEFTHKLLDWLEDAFQMKAEEETDEEKPKNPMVELFYGRFLAVGVLEGKKFENTEMFGQYPLQVNGFKDLHECLEAAMIEGEIESLHSDNSGKSGQEHWFTELPPVLTFELSRFEFNQALGRPEKIHNKLEFPQVLYLDRYMHRNREITRIKREEIKRLKDYLTVLQQRLERYLSYGSGPKRFPLVDVLQYALEFASSKPVCTSPVDDIDASSSTSGSIPSQASPSPTEQQGTPASEPPSSAPAAGAALSLRTVIHKPFTQSRIPPDLPMHPAPRHITEEELSVLESCLHRWRTEIENDTRDLQESISRIHRTIELMYSDKSMIQVPYRLHAVLVHEGQANAGHYWAYIFDHRESRWMKYNDIAVTKSSWEELVRDSFGGYRNASAYCLMYINDKAQFLIQEEFNKETGQALVGLETLPPDLRDFVEEDNQRFEKELEEWDTQLAQRALQEKLLAAQKLREAEFSAATAQAGGADYLEQPPRSDFSKHWKEETVRVITKAAHEHGDKGPETVLQSLFMENILLHESENSPLGGHGNRITGEQEQTVGKLAVTPSCDMVSPLNMTGKLAVTPSCDRVSPLTLLLTVTPSCDMLSPLNMTGKLAVTPSCDMVSPLTLLLTVTPSCDMLSPLNMTGKLAVTPSCDMLSPLNMTGKLAVTPSCDMVSPLTLLLAVTPSCDMLSPLTLLCVKSEPAEEVVNFFYLSSCGSGSRGHCLGAWPQGAGHFTSALGVSPVHSINPENATSQPPSSQQVVEVAIPHIGKLMVESKEGGYDDEAIKLEYSRLVKLAQEDTPPETDYRLHHVLVYFIQNQAPKKIIEKTLLEQFGDRNLSFDERCHNIMKVAQAKLEMIKPEEVNLEEYEKLNEQAAEMFESGEDREVNNGLIIMNEFIVPFLPLLLVDEMEEKDILAVEDMRNRWCSYLGQEMESSPRLCHAVPMPFSVTPDLVLHPRYSSGATVPNTSRAKAWRLKRRHRETMVIRKEISRMPLYSAFGKSLST
ncbi:Ubiquitin carboxyl-terminal hydrolase 25 [Microtus ochrogaster]|uniref:ubiquitinyl hydrolase 1 n=1 Tax=Microtus ochrogaster TaxID=79684 RepID=A0A8J6GC40_MICOH|nr:Ubiquitin carboxyl-terminal hydrolase 25 [Microtus ochrogaster]